MTDADVLADLRTVTARLGTTPERMLARYSFQVGYFPRSRPLPRVEDLTPDQLRHLQGIAVQTARLAADRDDKT